MDDHTPGVRGSIYLRIVNFPQWAIPLNAEQRLPSRIHGDIIGQFQVPVIEVACQETLHAEQHLNI